MAGPRLLGRVRAAIRARHYSYRTEQAYVHWIRRFIRSHGRRHPAEMGKREVEAFLTDLAVRRDVSASTRNQALSAILFLYRSVLEQELDWIENVVRAKRRVREPVVLSNEEVRAIFGHLREPYHLMALLMYGAGLRLRECLRLRVKDTDSTYRQIPVRDGKGGKDRVTVLPDAAVCGLERQVERARAILAADEREHEALFPRKRNFRIYLKFCFRGSVSGEAVPAAGVVPGRRTPPSATAQPKLSRPPLTASRSRRRSLLPGIACTGIGSAASTSCAQASAAGSPPSATSPARMQNAASA